MFKNNQLKEIYKDYKSQPWISLSIIATISLTVCVIGATAALSFNTVFKPLSYPESDRIYKISNKFIDKDGPRDGEAFFYPSLIDIYKNTNHFEKSSLIQYSEDLLLSSESQPLLNTTYVTSEWFEILDTPMFQGRSFLPHESFESNVPVAVISYHTWESVFHSDPSTLGNSITLGEHTYEIIGITDQNFIEPEIHRVNQQTNIWLPFDFNPTTPFKRNSWAHTDTTLYYVGLVNNLTDISNIELSITEFASRKWKERVAGISFLDGWEIYFELTRLKSAILKDTLGTVIYIIIGAISVFCIAILNLTNIFIADTSKIRENLSIRAQVGANPGHLTKYLALRFGSIIFLSAILGCIFSIFLKLFLTEWLSSHFPRLNSFNGTGITTLTSIVLALFLTAILSILSSRSINYKKLINTIQSSGKGTSVETSEKTRVMLIFIQVFVSSIILIPSLTLSIDSTSKLLSPPPFKTENIYSLRLSSASKDYPSQALIYSTYESLRTELLKKPGIVDSSRSLSPVKKFSPWQISSVETNENYLTRGTIVDDNYLTITDLPLTKGRFFEAEDIEDFTAKIVIDDNFASRLSENGNPIGQYLSFGSEPFFEIIGIVKHIELAATADNLPQVLVPVSVGKIVPNLVASKTPIEALVKVDPNNKPSRLEIIDALKNVSSQFNMYEWEHLTESANQAQKSTKLLGVVSVFIWALISLLFVVGIYGVISFGLNTRRKEFAIRSVFGANALDHSTLLLKEYGTTASLSLFISLATIALTYQLLYSSPDNYFIYLVYSSIACLAFTIFVIAAACLGSILKQDQKQLHILLSD